jgi:NAD(P)-dependent dehydrogenase (short-subunit alcohol dehydrogenase family)
MSKTVLVTGAARGLGLEFCRQLSAAGHRVIACPRTSGEADLERLAAASADRVRIEPVDVTDDTRVRELAASLEGEAVDVLIGNAGVFPSGGSAERGFDTDALLHAYRVNAVAPLSFAHALLPALRRGSTRKIAHVTSLMGSIGDNTSGGSYAYRMSKAALNQATRTLALELGSDGFTVLVLHPGWVRTRMGGSGAPLEIDASVAGMIRVIEAATPRDGGRFLAWDGRELPW